MFSLFRQIYVGFRTIARRLLGPIVANLAAKVDGSPKRAAVFAALSDLYNQTIDPTNDKKGPLFPFNPTTQRVIIFSDQHKGSGNGADDFLACQPAYLAALSYYDNQKYYYINLGDSEELWENNVFSVMKQNVEAFAAEKKFMAREACFKIYGNHDSIWRFDPLAPVYLKQMFDQFIPIYGGIVLRISLPDGRPFDVFCTHGHQGDATSDGNWFSAAFVSYIWAPLQAFLGVSSNTPSDNAALKSLHNEIMYAWSEQTENLMLITGHTHQPVFNSLTHLERLLVRRGQAMAAGNAALVESLEAEIPKRRNQFPHVSEAALKPKPSYFNTGCCCFSNGKITGIEISDGFLRLVKWEIKDGQGLRTVLEQQDLIALGQLLSGPPAAQI